MCTCVLGYDLQKYKKYVIHKLYSILSENLKIEQKPRRKDIMRMEILIIN